MTTNLHSQLQALREKCGKATPGRREAQLHPPGHGPYFGNVVAMLGKNGGRLQQIRTITCHLQHGTPDENKANIEFDAATDPQVVQALIDVAEAAERFYKHRDNPKGMDTALSNLTNVLKERQP